MAEHTQLLRDLRNLRVSIAGGESLNQALRRMADSCSKNRGLAVCKAIDAVEEELALVDAAIAKLEEPEKAKPR